MYLKNMKKLIITLITVLIIFTHTYPIATASEAKTLESIELTAGDSFYISYDTDSRDITFFDYEIIAKYTDGSSKVLSNYRRHQVVYNDSHSVVKINAVDKTYSFKITFITNQSDIKRATVYSCPENSCIVKYICATGEQILSAENLICKLEYSSSEAEILNMKTSQNTAVSEGGSYYLTLENALIYKNNYSNDDNSNFFIDFCPDGETPTPPETAPELQKYAFSGWFADKKCETPYDFQVPINESTVIYAGWRYNMRKLTVINGTQSGEYAVGSEVTVTADNHLGKRFMLWRSETPDFTIENKYKKNLSFIMPDFDLTITAVYTDCYHFDIHFSADNEKTHSGICSCGQTVVKPHEFILHKIGDKTFLVCSQCGYKLEKQQDNIGNQPSDDKPGEDDSNGNSSEENKPHISATPTDGIKRQDSDSQPNENKDNADEEQYYAQTIATGENPKERCIYILLFIISLSSIFVLTFKKHKTVLNTKRKNVKT